jgi:hypothetical protein
MSEKSKSAAPKDNFLTKEKISTTTAKVPAVKARDLSGSLRETHGPSLATKWETGGDNHASPAIRSFHGSKPNRVKK